MDGEHIEMIISGWSSTELREKALVELGRMREELYVLRQFTRGLTPRALDGATCPCCHSSNVFTAIICVACGAHTSPRQ